MIFAVRKPCFPGMATSAGKLAFSAGSGPPARKADALLLTLNRLWMAQIVAKPGPTYKLSSVSRHQRNWHLDEAVLYCTGYRYQQVGRHAMANLGFIGLGTMGGPMVKRLLSAGHQVTGYNRTRSRGEWLVDLGMRWGPTPREVALAADMTFTMLANTEAVQAVTGGPDGVLAGLRPGSIYIDMSTVSPSASQALAARVAEQGAQMLDAPVSGSVVTLEAGQLSIMVGGEREVFEKARPVLQDIGPTVNYVGKNGLAVMMKVAINLSLPVQILSFCESILLAEKSGIPRETAVEVLLNSVVASPALKYRIPLVLDPPEQPLFDVNMIQKDLLLALEMGRELQVPLPTTALTNEWLTAARGMGLSDQDFAILFKVLATLAGVEQ